jgi:hypothetical protein
MVKGSTATAKVASCVRVRSKSLSGTNHEVRKRKRTPGTRI